MIVLDRGIIKSQAKQLIKGNVFALFVIALICMALSNAGSFITSIDTTKRIYDNPNSYSYSTDDWKNYFENPGSFYRDDDDDDSYYEFDDDDEDKNNFYNFGQKDSENDFYNFTGSLGLTGYIDRISVNAVSWIGFFLSALLVALDGYFVRFVRGKEVTVGSGISEIFKKTFDSAYFKRLVLFYARTIIVFLWSLLFIIPGIVAYYKYYFATQILEDNPELSVKDALRLSKELTQGSKSELFLLDLSFIGWYFLCVFIFPMIYVVPYYMTTKSLFYENFRIRAFATGQMNELDFLSEQQRINRMAQMQYQNAFTGSAVNFGGTPQQSNTQGAQSVQGSYYHPSEPQYSNAVPKEVNPGNHSSGSADAAVTDKNDIPPVFTPPVSEDFQPVKAPVEEENKAESEPENTEFE